MIVAILWERAVSRRKKTWRVSERGEGKESFSMGTCPFVSKWGQLNHARKGEDHVFIATQVNGILTTGCLVDGGFLPRERGGGGNHHRKNWTRAPKEKREPPPPPEENH